MKKYLVLYAVAVTALFAFSYHRYHAENRRLIQNQTALAADFAHYRTRAGQEAASAQVLRLRCGEFEALRAADAEEIRRLGLRIRRLEAAAKTATATEAAIRAPLRDTVVIRLRDSLPVRDSERLFRWLRLNQWIATATVGWVPVTIYDKTQWNRPEWQGLNVMERRLAVRQALRGKRCYGGLDLSKSTDLTAFVLVFPPQEGLETWAALFWGWVPLEDLRERLGEENVVVK